MDQGRGSGYGAEVGQKLNYGNATVWQKTNFCRQTKNFQDLWERKNIGLTLEKVGQASPSWEMLDTNTKLEEAFKGRTRKMWFLPQIGLQCRRVIFCFSLSALLTDLSILDFVLFIFRLKLKNQVCSRPNKRILLCCVFIKSCQSSFQGLLHSV